MATLTIRLPDDKHYRLKELVQAKGNPEKGLKILAKLDAMNIESQKS